MPANGAKNNWRIMANGNTAYRLDVQGNTVRVPKTEPRRKRQESQRPYPRTRSKVELRPQGKISITAVVGFTMVAMLAVGVLTSYIELTDIYADTVAAQAELSELRKENSILVTEYETVFDAETLQEAAEEAGLQEPTANQKVYLELSDPDNAVVYQTEEKATGLKGVWQAVKSFFAGIGTYFS